MALLGLACENRALIGDAGGGGEGGAAQPTGAGPGGGGGTAGGGGTGNRAVGGDGGGAGPGLAGAGGASAETGCAFVTPSSEGCAGVDTLSLSDPTLADYAGDAAVSAGEAATVSITLEGGDQGFPYPSIGLTNDNPLVVISPAAPPASLYWLGPHLTVENTFDFMVDPSVAAGTVVHFTACPTTIGRFCPGGHRTSFDLVVQPKVPPSWTTGNGKPAGLPACASTAPSTDQACAGLEHLVMSNPRTVFWQNGSSLSVSVSAWLTNGDASARTVCARVAAAGQISPVAYPSVAQGGTAEVGFGSVALGAGATSGSAVHFTAWTGAVSADCSNVTRIEFDATIP
jgi:hypothetical protein